MFALSMAPRFADNQFFFTKLLGNDNPHEVRVRAAVSAIRQFRHGEGVPWKVIMKSITVLEQDDCNDITADELAETLQSVRHYKKTPALLAAYRAKLEGRKSDACKLLSQHVSENPEDTKSRLELGVLAYRNGYWGKYHDHIRNLKEFPNNTHAADALESVESFLDFCSARSALPAESLIGSAMQSPASVFEHVLNAHARRDQRPRNGIAMIAPSLAGGGAERIAATIFRELSDNPEPVEMVLYEDFHDGGRDGLFYLPLTELSEEDIRQLDTNIDVEEPFGWLPPNLSRQSQAIYNYLLEARPRALYLTLDMPSMAGGFAGVLADVPVMLLHCHNMRPTELYGSEGSREGWARAYRALLARDEVRMITVCEAAARDYREWIGTRPEKVRVVRNGLDLRQLAARDGSFVSTLRANMGIGDDHVVGAAIRFEEVKRPDLWLRMARLVVAARNDVHFVLFGDGALLEKTIQSSREMGLYEKVHFAGHVDDLYRRLPLLDVFVLSSWSEGLPNVLLEAQAAGAFPIAFDVGGCAEAMIDGVTGLLVPEQSDRALADAVLGVLGDQKLREGAKMAGKEFVMREFSVQKMMAGLMDALDAT